MNLLEFTDLPWVVWRPLSLNLAFVISQKLMVIHHGVSKKDKADKRIFEVYQKFFLRSNEKVDGDEAVQNKRMKADLDGVQWKMRWKKLFNIFIAYILIVLIALLLKISSVVYKKGGSMSASNKLTFWFPQLSNCFFSFVYKRDPGTLALSWNIWPPKMGCRGHFGPQAQFSGWNTEGYSGFQVRGMIKGFLGGRNNFASIFGGSLI